MSGLVQGLQDITYENAVPDEPGIVERRHKSMFIPVEAFINEEPMFVRTDRALEAEVILVYGQARIDGEVTMIVLALGG